jgi:serine/threonine protein kinase
MMRTDWQALEDAAHRLTPTGATLTHLCSSGLSTFQVETRGGDFYALKVIEVLSPACERSDEEWAALPQVDHPHVVPYLDAGLISGDATSYRWLTMEFVEGMSLDAYLDQAPSHDLSEMVGLLRDAVAGAAALWDAGIAHRDLTPENMIVTPSGRLVIVDLGMAEVPDGQSVSGVPRSPRFWTAPEQIAAGTTFGDWRSDQYVLGLLGYRLVTGSEPFFEAPNRGETTAVEAAQHSPMDRNPDVPALLADIIATMLASHPQDRWPRGDVLLAAIDDVLASLTRGRVATHPHADGRRTAISCATGSRVPL